MNAATFLHKAAMQQPEQVALEFAEQSMSYGELSDRVRRLARALLDLGLAPGDRMAVYLPNGIELVETIQAGLTAGLCVVPINFRLHPSEVAYIVEDSAAQVIVEHADLASTPLCAPHRICPEPSGPHQLDYERLVGQTAPLAAPVEVDQHELAWLFYTSGTTGRPKGAIWTHRTITVLVMNHLADIYSVQPEDVVLHAAPLTHGSGVVLLSCLARGARNIILATPSFDAEGFFGIVARERVTKIAFLAPTQIVKLLSVFDRDRHDVSSLRCICYGGAPMFVEDLRRALDAFGPVLVQIYGQGEAPMTISYLRAADHDRFARTGDPRLSSAGIARTDVEVRIVDAGDQPVPTGHVGEISVRGDVVMAGYWNQLEATAQTLRDGWLHTGDVGLMDATGHLFLLDRSKDMIISGGNNIYPREVEEVILTLRDAEEVAVIGVPDDYWGESVHALVVPRTGATLDDQQVIAVCREHLASYKKPRTVEIVEALPKNAYGKILKRELRERYWADHDRRVAGGGIVDEHATASG